MDFSSIQIGAAFRLMIRTLPIILIRLGVTIAFWVVALIYLAIVGAVAVLIGNASEIIGVIVFLVALGAMIPLYNLAYRYVFFVIKAAHIAVIAELLVNDTLPDGVNQLAFGRKKVTERFGETNVMFVVDELVNGVVNAFTWTVYSITSWIPGDSVRTIVGIVNTVIRFAMNYIDEAILARSFTNERDNVWANARDGLVLYAMAWKPILLNAVVLMILSYIPFIVALLIFSAPIGLLVNLVSPQLAGWSIIAILLFAWLVKVAVGDAFAMTAIIAAYQRETAGKTPDPAMVDRLNGLSDKFGELMRKAGDSMGFNRQKAKNDSDGLPTTSAPASTFE
jgi:hypothetical protein